MLHVKCSLGTGRVQLGARQASRSAASLRGWVPFGRAGVAALLGFRSDADAAGRVFTIAIPALFAVART